LVWPTRFPFSVTSKEGQMKRDTIAIQLGNRPYFFVHRCNICSNTFTPLVLENELEDKMISGEAEEGQE
jgi:hypothetical protein